MISKAPPEDEWQQGELQGYYPKADMTVTRRGLPLYKLGGSAITGSHSSVRQV